MLGLIYSGAKLLNLVALLSDHNLIVLDASPVWVIKKPRSFKFENKWLAEEDLPYVVRKSWEGFQDLNVLPRLEATTGILSTWGDHKAKAFVNTNKEYEEELRELQGKNDM
ncbi:hypothetical protein ACS0TY_003142 [Phlomoides rotata]